LRGNRSILHEMTQKFRTKPLYTNCNS
jgi:hypothetical protein